MARLASDRKWWKVREDVQQPANIALIGYRATGKSTVAARLAALLDWPVIDTDREIQRRSGRSIKELFAEGERVFRDWESRVLGEVAGRPAVVLSLGGGAVVRPDNQRLLAESFVVWLQADVETIVQRMAGDAHSPDQRPQLTVGGRAEVADLLAQRTPIYQRLAHLVLDTTAATPEQLAAAIAEAWDEMTRRP